ncbi:glycosyltransferase family 4 protein [Mannheimia haemolytica]
MSVYIFALGIKSSNGLVKSTINTANAFADEGTDVSVINILGSKGGFEFLDPAFKLKETVHRYSLDALSEYYPESMKNIEFHTENQQFLKANFHQGHCEVLKVLNAQLTENDLVIFSHPLAMVLFAKANPYTNAKTIIQVHGNYMEELDNMALLKDYVDYVDYIQTVSSYMRDDLIPLLNVDPEKIVCIYNITRPIPIQRKPSKLKRISIIGSIQKRKNQLDAVKMLSLIEDRNVILQIYGNTLKKEYLEQIKFFIDNNQLQDRVLFKGVCSEEDIYQNTDIVIMTSEHEGFPYIFMESFSYGIPIVTYDFKYGAREGTDNNANGCLIPMGDYHKMADVVSELLKNEERYLKTIEYNTNYFNRNFTEKKILEDYHSLFENINRQVFFDAKRESELSISNISCKSNSIEVIKPWNNTLKNEAIFEIKFNLSKSVQNLEFFYIYKKSRFSVDSMQLANSIFNRFEQEIILRIPQINRISMDKPMEKFQVGIKYGDKTYIVAEIVKGALSSENIDKYPQLLHSTRIENIFTGQAYISDIPHILRPNGFFIAYPTFEAIRSIRDENGDELEFTTQVIRFYGKDLLTFKLKSGLYRKLSILMNSGEVLTIDFNQYSYKNVFQKLLSLEKTYNLYDVRVCGVYIWELIRVVIFEHILEATGVLGTHFSKPNHVNNIWFGDSSLKEMPEKERLLFEFPRKGDIDYRTIAFKTQFNSEVNVFEYPQKNGYSDAYNEENVFPIKEFLDFCQKDQTKIEFSAEDKQIIRWFKQLFIEMFGLDIEFSLFMNARIIKFLREFNYFNEFFKYSNYKEVAIPSAYWSAGIIAAARNNGIITADIQYALISPYHPSFSFDTPARAYGADRVYLWSSYWNIKETTYNKSFVLESNYFKEKIKVLGISLKNDKSDYDIAFVSQGRIGKKIFNFALDFAHNYPSFKIIYCPHPDELLTNYPRYYEAEKYPNFSFNTEDTLIALSHSKYVVGVYSTSLIEGIALGKRVFSLTLGGHEVMEREVEKGFLAYINNTEELYNYINQQKTEKYNTDFSRLLYNFK